MRDAFAAEITELATEDARLVLLSGDIGNRLFERYKQRHPDRFLNCGVAEANMISMAAGMALSGLRPVAYTIAPFVTTRCLEQIRVDLCYHNLPVVIVGVGAGLSYASLGGTHHACEDIALLRVLPNMSIVCPGDAMEVRLAIRAALGQERPIYIRLGKKGEPAVHERPPEFVIGKGIVLRQGSDVCLLSTGTVLPLALAAATRLERDGVSAQVVSFHTVKPLDERLLTDVAGRIPLVVTIEEHSVLGGLGGSVAEWLADGPSRGVRLLRIGTADEFMHGGGEQEHAREHFGLTAEKVAERTLATLGVIGRR
ncbi:MAG: transketolase [Elusimicrobia bacterium GWA2_69_24]|nr:MAG: transketolase [Candidatus Rokubacteria bacterium RBG_16_73_20]OGR60862.1 MAG: transketolase [Elusimicrobia bacterium GWA2_69_24]HBH00803.1 transketolase [Candidatus Rokubacteria bacterium]